MPRSASRLFARLGVPRSDVALALGLAVAGIVWVSVARHSGDGDVGMKVLVVPHPPAAPETMFIPDPHQPDQGVDSTAFVVNLTAALAVAGRRRWPYAALVIALSSVLVLRSDLVWPGFLAILVCAYSAVAYGRWLLGALAILAVAAAAAAKEFSNSIPSMPGWLTPFAVLAPVGLAAAAIRGTRAKATAAARRADALEREREASTRAAIAEERARIARELHDVVSHHVSVMVIQAGAAGKVIDRRPDLAANALAAIESSGRDAMAELRHLLGLVAPLDNALRPQPGLADLDTLVASVRGAGLPVTLRRSGGPVPPAVDLTVYRIVQEALTNALRYAPGTPTSVDIDTGGDAATVAVRNGPPSGPAPDAPVDGAGSGLLGLAERVRLFGGEFTAGPRPTGGFAVRARIPRPATDPAGSADPSGPADSSRSVGSSGPADGSGASVPAGASVPPGTGPPAAAAMSAGVADASRPVEGVR